MAGSINLLDKCSKGMDNKQFHLEMYNVASTKGKQEYLHGETYMQGDANSHGSVLSLKERSDTQPLTEWHACRYEECMKFHSPVHNDPESPASPLKNVFFFFVIILLVVWVLIYAILNKMKYI